MFHIHFHLDVNVERRDGGLVCGHQARMAIVDQKVDAKSSSAQVVDATRPEVRFTEDGGGFHAGHEGAEEVCKGRCLAITCSSSKTSSYCHEIQLRFTRKTRTNISDHIIAYEHL